MLYKIEIKDKPGIFDAVGVGIKKDILDLGIKTVERVHFVRGYIIEGSLFPDDVRRICEELLVDRIAQDYSINEQTVKHGDKENEFIIEVAYNQGVMDPVEDSTLKGIRDLGINSVNSIKTAKKYLIKGRLSAVQLKIISEKLLCNKLIQHIVKLPDPRFGVGTPSDQLPVSNNIDYQFNLFTVDLLGAGDEKLKKISQKGQLFLNLTEMRQIKNYFKKLKRNPTDCELETIAQTWSEHCGHKTFRGKIRYTEKILNSKFQIPVLIF